MRKAIELVTSPAARSERFKNVDTDAALQPKCPVMRGLRWLLRAVIALTVLVFCALLWVVHQYELDLKTAWKRAVRQTPAFTVDASKLPVARYARVVWLGDVPGTRINETSGLAASRRNRDLLWTINDSGGGPFLHAVGEDGRYRGSLRVQGATNFDWEDLDAFELDGVAYLLIADVGDNFSFRPAVTLYVVKEPLLAGERFKAGAEIAPTWVLRVRYEGGPEDCEAVAVDAQRRRVLLLSKRAVPPVLYSAPLVPRHDDPRAVTNLLVARRLTAVPGIPQPTADDIAVNPGYGRYLARPTAMDISRDGTRAVVFNYESAFLFEREPGESWSHTFARLPRRVRIPRLSALEAGAFGLDGQTLYISSENLPAPIIRLDPPIIRSDPPFSPR